MPKKEMPSVSAGNSREGNEKFESVKGVRAFYIRHMQKSVSEKNRRITPISTRGIIEGLGLGEFLKSRSGKITNRRKVWSGEYRTKETAHVVGYAAECPDVKEHRFIRSADLDYPKVKGLRGFFAKLAEARAEILQEVLEGRGITDVDLEDKRAVERVVDADIMEELEDKAQESVLAEWIENPDSGIAKNYPPQNMIDQVAPNVRKAVRMPGKLDDGSYVDLMHFTHVGVTEPLLFKIIVSPSGNKPEKIADFGGSFKTGEGFRVDTQVDGNGESQAKIYIYRRTRNADDTFDYHQDEYDIDLEELNRIADEISVKKNARDQE